MLISALLAFFIPFELFLFVYAFLGPLHYLTELNWLHQKGFFTTAKNDVLLLIIIIFIIGISVFSPMSIYLRKYLSFFIGFAFLSAIGMHFINNQLVKLIFYLLCLLISLGIFYLFNHTSEIIFSIFLPSLIHVFIFTGLFILVGALKTKNRTAKLSLIIFLLCGFSLLVIPLIPLKNDLNTYITSSYHSFERINRTLINLSSNNTTSIFTSALGIQIMRFIAFSYTYHYLNWFSKTSIIQWHKISKFKFISIILIWILSVALYMYDYSTGLKWLYLLSLAHVFLEFPLNMYSIKQIVEKVKKM